MFCLISYLGWDLYMFVKVFVWEDVYKVGKLIRLVIKWIIDGVWWEFDGIVFCDIIWIR